MSILFSQPWMSAFASEWNAEPGLRGELENIGFNSVIAYGFDGEDEPRAVLVVKKGVAVDALPYAGQQADWDLRAAESSWREWLAKPPGMLSIGIAYTAGRIKFLKGDYATMIKDPRLASPFVKSFKVMGRVK